MSKVINRAIKLAGETRKVGTPVVNVQEYDASGNVMRCTGATLPTDADAGYAKGCIFIDTSGSTGTTVYINEGSASSAAFRLGSSAGPEDVTATNAITSAESGKVFFLNSSTEFVSTLPAPAAGLRYTFIVKAAPQALLTRLLPHLLPTSSKACRTALLAMRAITVLLMTQSRSSMVKQ